MTPATDPATPDLNIPNAIEEPTAVSARSADTQRRARPGRAAGGGAASRREITAPADPPPGKLLSLKPDGHGPLRERGQRLWDAHHEQIDGQRGLVLLEEACRIADRLDQLDRLLRGDAELWIHLTLDRSGEVYEIRVDSALTEARQQAAVLRQLIASLPLKGPEAGDGDDWLDEV